MSLVHPIIAYVKKLIGAIRHHSIKLIAEIYYTLVRTKDKVILTDAWRALFFYPIAQLNSIIDQIKKYLKKMVTDLVNIQQVISLFFKQMITDIIQLSDKWRGIFHKIINQSNSIIDLIIKYLKKVISDKVSVSDLITNIFRSSLVDLVRFTDSWYGKFKLVMSQSNSIIDSIRKRISSLKYDVIQVSEKVLSIFISNIPKDYLSLKDIYILNYSRGIRDSIQFNDYIKKKTSTALTFPFTFPAVFGVGWGEWEEL